MFFAEKKTVYLSLYREGEKVKSVGFLQMIGMRDSVKVSLQIKNVQEIEEEDYPVVIPLTEKMIPIGSIKVRKGSGYFEKEFCTSGEYVLINGEEILPETVTGLTIILTEAEKVSGRNINLKEAELKAANETANEAEDRQKQELPIEIFGMDKWEQLKQKYCKIHPFGDERVFVSLQLEDLAVLPEKYHKLVHNSFLLHGFYNYRHLILGRDCKLGDSSKQCFYVGVPGVFFEREKQVAVMFGFEGFECAGPVDIGKFGYYVREVVI